MFYHSNVILHNLVVECRQSIAAIADCYNFNKNTMMHIVTILF